MVEVIDLNKPKKEQKTKRANIKKTLMIFAYIIAVFVFTTVVVLYTSKEVQSIIKVLLIVIGGIFSIAHIVIKK
ncbi:MAG: hypothetical protein ACK5MJ_06730 [Alphaproteobacteria bacterium]